MIKGRYFCLNQNPIKLVFYLYFFNKSLQLHSGLIRVNPFSDIRRLIQFQLHISGHRNIIRLPFYGSLCLRVHHGYKIFDFKKKTVIKIISPEVNPVLVTNELEAVKNASLLDFAPKLRDCNANDRWYEEDFINGCPFYANPKSKTTIALKIFHREILPCLKQMILLQQAQTVMLHAYVEKILQSTNRRLESISLIKDKESEWNSIKQFLEINSEALLLKTDTKIPLVFSHGDLSLVNMLNTKKGIKVIDWEGAKPRNPLYDLFNYFFTELYYKRISKELMPEIKQAIKALNSSVKTYLPEIAKSLQSFSEIYRKLYYLERICMLLMRDESERTIKVIINTIELFDSFENKQSSLLFNKP